MDNDPWDSDGFTSTSQKTAPSSQGTAQEALFPKEEVMPPEKGCAPASTPMPWGKHRGTPIGQIPRSYMTWCIENADSLPDDLRRSFEWMTGKSVGSTKVKADTVFKDPPFQPGSNGYRNGKGYKRPPDPPKTPPPPSEARIASLRGLVKSWYRNQSLLYHPDRGGSVEKQKILNECYRTLNVEIERWEKQR